MKNWNRIVLPLALVALTAGMAFAQDGAAPPRERRDGPPRAERPDGPPPNSPSAALERLKARLGEIGLTAEQKAKVEKLIAETAEEVKAAEKKLQESMQAFRKDLEGILDEQQLKKLGELTRPPGPGGGGTQMLQRLRDSMEKLDLTAEQKEKIKTTFDGLREKARDLMENHRDKPEEMRAALRELFEDARVKAGEILTPEQKAKLKELMPPRDGERGAGGDRPRDGGREGGNPPPPR